MQWLVEAQTDEEALEKCVPLMEAEYTTDKEFVEKWGITFEWTTSEFRCEEPYLIDES
jgi:hypothetical protein